MDFILLTEIRFFEMRGEQLRVGRPVKAAQLLFCRLLALREGCIEASRWVSRL